ncbi:type II restriction endonuclease [Erwinia billingiae]|uniref:type II restriction endonuclease n=1 Tax=Erwinia billingiae TaxID=182337 RepID=UPI000D08D2D8|nr:type II restriction endonuclease [Erwinia billingiae]PRB56262.1 type II restriction endonuclease [Erwinia billingiae]
MSNKRALRLTPACIKTLTKVEVDPKSSHQREFNGVFELKQMFGTEKKEFQAYFSIRGEDVSKKAEVTWYEARENHPVRSEYRLYFKNNEVMNSASIGDNIIIGFDENQELNIILIKRSSDSHDGIVSDWTRV